MERFDGPLRQTGFRGRRPRPGARGTGTGRAKTRFLGPASCAAVAVLAGAAAAQVPDVGPGRCVTEIRGNCDTYTPPRGSTSRGSPGSDDDGGAAAARRQAAIQHQQRMNQIMLNGFQSMMNSFWSGFQRGMELNRQRQEEMLNQARDMLRRQLEDERRRNAAARAALERNRRSLAAARDRISGAIRSMGATDLPARGVLTVREEAGAFGVRTLKPRELGAPVAEDTRARVACGQALMQTAGHVALSGSGAGMVTSLKEAAFLSRQAGAAARGRKLDVQCPADRFSDAGSAGDLELANEALAQQSEVFGALYDQVAGDMQKLLDLRTAARESEAALAEARTEHEAAKSEVEALQSSAAETTPPAPSEDAAHAAAREAKRRALQEALAALRDSEQVLGEVEALHDQNAEGMKHAEDELGRMQELMAGAGTDPDSLTSMRQALGLPNAPGAEPPN